MRLKGKKPKDKAYPKEVKTLGDAIRKRRLDLGLLQKDVAKIIGCDKISVLNWERGHTHPSAKHMPQVVIFLTQTDFGSRSAEELGTTTNADASRSDIRSEI